jgi:uncharacterized protein involved in exopolysaccharide biosynthesis/Mrp family chromosome partitioning ATPase
MSDQLKTTEKSVRDLLFVIFRHKWMLLIIFLIVSTSVAYVTLTATEIYQSKARLLVRIGRESVGLDPTAATGPTISIYQSRESEINSEIEILKSSGVLEDVVDIMGPDEILREAEQEGSSQISKQQYLEGHDISVRPKKSIKARILDRLNLTEEIAIRDKAVIMLAQNLSVKSNYNNNIIALSYQANSPTKARNILNEIINVYMDKHIEVHRSPGSFEFFSEETETLKNQLKKAEEELRVLKANRGVVELVAQRRLLLERIEDLETKVEENSAEIVGSRAKIEVMRRNLSSEVALEEAEYASLLAKSESLKRQLTNAKKKLKDINKSEIRIQQIERNIEILDVNYRRFSNSLELARIDQALEAEKISNISILQNPSLPVTPVSPQRKRNIAIGLFLGIVLGLVVAFIIEYLDHTFKSPDDVQSKLSIADVFFIPRINIFMLQRYLKRNTNQEIQNTLTVKQIAKNSTVWCDIFPNIRQNFENIKDYINHTVTDSDKSPFILAVTSCNREEGVSAVATGIAYAFARYDEENILLVDANSHHSNQDKLIALNRPPTLYEISVSRPIAYPDQSQTLYTFSSEHMDEYVSKVEGSKRFNKLVPSLQKMNYKMIIMDLPAINENISALNSARNADGTVLVIEAEKIKREVVNRTKEKLDNFEVKLMGVVLNKRKYHIPKWLYR